MQARYRKRYGSAPRQTNTTSVPGGGTNQPFLSPQETSDAGVYAPWAAQQANLPVPNPGTAGAAAAAQGLPQFDPLLDPTYAAGTVTYGYTDKDGYHPGTLVQHTQNEADYQRHQIGQSYGYDANGNLITSGADLNPYAQAAVMKRHYDAMTRGTLNSYAANGQLYSGALQNASDANDFNYGLSADQLKRATQGAYHGQDLAVQGAQDNSIANLLNLLGPAYANFLAGQRGS